MVFLVFDELFLGGLNFYLQGPQAGGKASPKPRHCIFCTSFVFCSMYVLARSVFAILAASSFAWAEKVNVNNAGIGLDMTRRFPLKLLSRELARAESGCRASVVSSSEEDDACAPDPPNGEDVRH